MRGWMESTYIFYGSLVTLYVARYGLIPCLALDQGTPLTQISNSITEFADREG